jgi:hypothetical protein
MENDKKIQKEILKTKYKKKSRINILLFVIIGIIIIGIVSIIAYSYVFKNHPKTPRPNNDNGPVREDFQFNETQIDEITLFFNSTTDIDTINNYCNKNRQNCFYYCRDIDPNNEFCKQLINISGRNMTRRDMPRNGTPSLN